MRNTLMGLKALLRLIMPVVGIIHLASALAIGVSTDVTLNQPWQSITPGGGGWYGAVGIGPAGLMAVGSDLSGAYISNNGGVSWTSVAAPQGLLATHVSAIGFHKTNAHIVFLGTDNGIYRSTDQAKRFVRVQSDNYITSIQSAHSNPNIMYAAGHRSYEVSIPNIYMSTDAGATWRKQASNGLAHVRVQKMIVHPTRSNEIYVVSAPDRFTLYNGHTLSVRAVYRSTDNGRSWTSFGTNMGRAYDFEIVQDNPNQMYLSTTTGVYYSSNAGVSWVNTKQPLTLDYLGRNVGYTLWLDPKDKNSIRLLSNELTVWTNDKGGSWMGTKNNNSFSWVFQNKGQSAFNGKAGWEMPDYWHYNSLKNVDLWSKFYYSGESLRTVAVDPHNAKRLVIANDQWVFQTTDGGKTFKQNFSTPKGSGWRSRGIENVNVYDVAASRWTAGGNVILGGYADMGCWRSLDDGGSWESCNAIQYTRDNPEDTKSSDGWNGAGGNVTAFEIDHDRKGVVWAAMGSRNVSDRMTLLRNNAAGKFDRWQYSSTGIAVDDMKNIYGVSIDTTSSVKNRTLFLTANGDVYRSKDDGWHWKKVLSCRNRTLAQNKVEAYCITTAVDHFNGKLVYAAGSAGVFVSSNGGDTWKWTNTTQMMEPIESIDALFADYAEHYFVSKIVTDLFVPNRVYTAIFDTRKAANSGGIWAGTAGLTWKRLYANRYARSLALSPYIKNEMVITSSSTYVSGGYNQQAAALHHQAIDTFNPQSLGVLQQHADGQWMQLANGLNYNNVSTIAYGNKPGRLVLGAMGQGVMRNWR